MFFPLVLLRTELVKVLLVLPRCNIGVTSSQVELLLKGKVKQGVVNIYHDSQQEKPSVSLTIICLSLR